MRKALSAPFTNLIPTRLLNYQTQLVERCCRERKWRGLNCEIIVWGQLKCCQEFVRLVGDKALRAVHKSVLGTQHCLLASHLQSLFGPIMRQSGGNAFQIHNHDARLKSLKLSHQIIKSTQRGIFFLAPDFSPIKVLISAPENGVNIRTSDPSCLFTIWSKQNRECPLIIPAPDLPDLAPLAVYQFDAPNDIFLFGR